MIKAVTIFHYHLLPGGVTSVIALSCEALARYMPEISRITLVSGTADNVEAVAKAVRERITGLKVTIETAVLDDIGYVTGMSVPPSVAAIKAHLSVFSGSLWWIHNYHLGKNPQFTQALLEILAEDPHQQLLFHIHDFPECARYENLQRLKNGLTRNPYPRGRNVRYALINRRDLDLMARSELPGDDLFLLNNPVRKSSSGRKDQSADKSEIRRKLKENFGRENSYDPESLHLFYPVRTIRRKNILEAGAWARLAGEYTKTPASLIVTLPGVSAGERKYSAAVEQAFEEELIPGLWGIGRKLDAAGIPFGDLGRSCDMMITSSVQEGFGYLFVEALQWGLPLFARDLDILDGIRGFFDSSASHFYTAMNIPAEKQLTRDLKKAYLQKLDNLERHLPADAEIRLEQEIDEIGRAGGIDFSILSVEKQLEVLTGFRDKAYLAETLALNTVELERFNAIKGRTPDPVQVERAEEQFSFENFTRRTRDIFNSFTENDSRQQKPNKSTQQILEEAFARLRFIRLLYDY